MSTILELCSVLKLMPFLVFGLKIIKVPKLLKHIVNSSKQNNIILVNSSTVSTSFTWPPIINKNLSLNQFPRVKS